MKKTKIEWCDSTWNPVTGCKHGCEYCYARRITERFRPFDFPHMTIEGVRQGINYLSKPIIMECKDGKERICAYPYGFEPTFHSYRLDEPAQWKEPRNIFVCSMADLFGNWVPDSWIEEVFAACERAPQHRYLFLTKNPDGYIRLAQTDRLPQKGNMWYGTTVPTEETELFYQTKFNSFISIEPIMSSFSLQKIRRIWADWVIIGAETGNRKGKVVPRKEWIDNISVSCQRYNVPVFMKDSLISIVGEENMRREFPWDLTDRRNELCVLR